MGCIFGIQIMAILLRKDGEKIYFSTNGSVTEKEKEQADRIDKKLGQGLKILFARFLQDGLITDKGRKKDALKIWFEVGHFLADLAKKEGVFGTADELFFWQATYDHLPKEIVQSPPPKNSRELSSNQYRKAAMMAQYPWSTVKKVGRWAVWNDILDNPKILDDKRILDWIVNKVVRNPLPHKEIRKFLFAVSVRFRRIDTRVLNSVELLEKLGSVKGLV